MQRKVLIIGIDGGTWEVLGPAVEGGFMPCLSGLISGGTSGVIESTIPAITPAAWSCFQTGCRPGKTGVFDFYYWDRAEKKIHCINAGSLPPTLWEIAGQSGRRVGAINVPMTYPPKTVNGYLVTGILTPSIESEFTFPAGLREELLNAVGDYHIFNLKNIAKKAPSNEQFELFLEQMTDIIRVRTEAAKYIIAKEPLDVFMVHFQASDVVQHVFWGYLDRSHESFSEEKRRSVFEKFYKVLDGKISEAIEAYRATAGEDFLTLVVSDHGFQIHRKRFNLGNWLVERGYLKIDKRAYRKPAAKKFTEKFRLGRFCRWFLPQRSINKIGKILDPERIEVFWEESRAFSTGRSSEGFIYLLDEDNDNREKAAAELVFELEKIYDPQTGLKIAEKVYRKEELFEGDRLEHLPDIVIEPSAGYSFTGLYQSGKGLFEDINSITDVHIGKHHRDGIFIITGTGIKKGYRTNARLEDMTPVVLYYLGIPAHANMDGCVRKEFFTEDFLAGNPEAERVDAAVSPIDRLGSSYTNEDEAKISERLEDLGYL